jgi:uncharacterized membrane protein
MVNPALMRGASVNHQLSIIDYQSRLAGKGVTMTRNNIHKILNPFLAVLAVNQAVTVLFREKLSHEAFEFFHQGAGAVFLALIAVHFILNFNWVKANYFRK